MQLERLVAALDKELVLTGWNDDSNNGLQVANGGRATKVALGVDATLPFFERAAACGADLAICHHGLSWGDSLKRITGLNYRLLAFLLKHDLALWACHLPLDAHPRLGNNACLARALGLRARQPFGLYHGRLIGVRGVLPQPESPAAFQRRVARAVGGEARALAFGKPAIRSVGVISGGAASQVADAIAEGLDAYVTGESNLQAYNLAVQQRIHAVFAGHYATERFGVRAVGAWIARRFHLPVEFVDLGIPY